MIVVKNFAALAEKYPGTCITVVDGVLVDAPEALAALNQSQIEDIEVGHRVAQMAQERRSERDQALSASDWSQMPDTPLTGEKRALWATYRQALRDLTDQPGFPEVVKWPEVPK